MACPGLADYQRVVHSPPALRPSHLALLFFGLFDVAGAVNLQAPLYRLYATQQGYGTAAVTVVFGAYVVGLLPVLVFLGGLSDRFGRKRVVLAAIACSLSATIMVTVAPTLGWLLGARVLQGLGIAFAMPAITAWVAEGSGTHLAAAVTSAATTLGFGSGAMVTSLLTDGVSPVPVSYPAAVVVLTLGLLGVLLVPSERGQRHRAIVRGPAFPRGSMVAGIALGTGWGVAGLVISILPIVLGALDALAWSGPALFAMLLSGALAQRHARRVPPAHALRLGAAIQSAAIVVLVLGALSASALVVCLGAVAGGVASHGYTFAGGLTHVARSAPPKDRSRAVSGYFLIGYVGFAALALGVGPIADGVGAPGALVPAAGVVLLASAFVARQARSASSVSSPGVAGARDGGSPRGT